MKYIYRFLIALSMMITAILIYPFLLIWIFIGYSIWHFKKCPYTYEFGGKKEIIAVISYIKTGTC